jgi:hypothetical protein
VSPQEYIIKTTEEIEEYKVKAEEEKLRKASEEKESGKRGKGSKGSKGS